MTSNTTKSDRSDILKIMGIVGSSAPKLFFRFVPLILKFKKQAKKGGEIFYQELIHQGLDEETAHKLTSVYLEASDVFQLFKIFQ